jgi:DNA repair exonuclease SbcCD nuclease subunit
MIRILFTDTHFGVKQNSITWLESQMDFIDSELIPGIKKLRKENPDEHLRLIHLGDVFDSRSSISPMVGMRVRMKFLELRSLVDDFYIVAGNHDFYSPNSDEIESLSLVFKDCDINLVIDKVVMTNGDMFIPWYKFKEMEYVRDLIAKVQSAHIKIRNVYTHADIFGEDRVYVKGIRLFSGHIHIPRIEGNMYNLGSCYALNFADANHDRCWYVIDANDELQTIPNGVSIRFWRLRNEEIFDVPGQPKDYYELYIDQANMQIAKYTDRIAELAKKYKNLWVIPIIKSQTGDNEELESYDIEEICRSMVPEHLKDKFKKVEESIK